MIIYILKKENTSAFLCAIWKQTKIITLCFYPPNVEHCSLKNRKRIFFNTKHLLPLIQMITHNRECVCVCKLNSRTVQFIITDKTLRYKVFPSSVFYLCSVAAGKAAVIVLSFVLIMKSEWKSFLLCLVFLSGNHQWFVFVSSYPVRWCGTFSLLNFWGHASLRGNYCHQD